MSLQPGTRLGNYEVLSDLGRGGMGEVYKARDLKLGREVAIKVLPQEMAADAQRLRRFEQEARAASALNHPNIVTIYEIGEHEGTPYIAMELVDGKSLREMLADGPLPNDKLIRYATQMAEGLAKAHQAGIVHRDLKPENIVISNDGYVKILDFGLAKLMQLDDVGSDVATMEKEGTTPGTVLGTVAYMSPEQAKGQPTDFRSDQFSFGAVLYEMATGERAFGRETAAESLAAVLNETPKLNGTLGNIVRRCLKKSAGERWPSTKDVAEALSGPITPKAEEPSIAVLPFANMSADREQEYFCDGMAEEIINSLTRVRDLRVVARTSAFAFKNKAQDIREIGQKLAVNHILEGGVRKAGTRLRITAQLTNVANGYQIWSERYDRALDDVFATQDEISAAIVQQLRVKLTSPLPTLQSRRPRSLEAYDAYLRGRYHWAKGTNEGYTKSIQCFEEAVDKEPTYALAYAGLSDAYSWFAFFGLRASADMLPRARDSAVKALELDPTLAEAHASLGTIKFFFDWDWSGAEKEFQRALELNPDSPVVHQQYAVFLGNLGRIDAAIETVRRAIELDPLWVKANQDLAFHFYIARRYDDAILQIQKTIELDPVFRLSHLVLGFASLESGQIETAIDAFRKGASVGGGSFFQTGIACSLARAGHKDEAREILGELSKAPAEERDPIHIAWVLAALGDLDGALDSLEPAYELRAAMLVSLPSFPWFDPLRDDPRFQDLLRRMNFPE